MEAFYQSYQDELIIAAWAMFIVFIIKILTRVSKRTRREINNYETYHSSDYDSNDGGGD